VDCTVIFKRVTEKGGSIESELEQESSWEKVLRIATSWVAIVITVLFGGAFLYGLIQIGMRGYFDDVFLRHIATLVGLPSAAMAALGLVILLRTVAGQISVKFLGMEFKGASGPIIMWILCFLAITFAIKYTWQLEVTPSSPHSIQAMQ
jgi:hypothetical protein